MEWYPRKPQSYRSDTWGLTLAEHGAYCLLLDYYYMSERPLPADDRALASIIGCTLDEWHSVKPAVTRYFSVTNSLLTHHACDEVIEAQLAKRKGTKDRVGAFRERVSKALENQESVTRYERVSNDDVTPLEERRGEERKEDSSIEESSALDLDAGPDLLAEAVRLWNEMAPRVGLASVQHLSAKRKSSLKARLKECGGLDGWVIALGKVEASDFLAGRSKDWRASFDFVLQASSFTKLMEGQYDNRDNRDGSPTRPGGPSSPHPNSPKAAFDRLKAELAERCQ